MADDNSGNHPNEPLKSVGRINRRMKRAAGGESKQWWNESQKNSRRKFIIGGALAAGAVVGGGVLLLSRSCRNTPNADDREVEKDSLDLQRASGWNVGAEDKPLTLPNAQTLDSQKSDVWKKYLNQNEMLRAYQPKDAAWTPFFVPTLIQSLQFDSLQKQLAPIQTPDMPEAYARGQAIGKDFLVNAPNAREVAIIADLPGRDAVAFGAGLADTARVITTFDNFPHPLGVTASHETLAAMLNYAGEVEAKQASLPANAPPVFLLDSNRLAEYKDADSQFDNRYLAKIPSGQALKEKGIKSIIYVTPDRARTQELDDLNDDFVAYKSNGLNVAMLPLSDLTRVEETLASAKNGNNSNNSSNASPTYHYYYGGSPYTHYYFFRSYPFYTASPRISSRIPSSIGSSGARVSSAPSISAPSYSPAPRATMFSASRVGAGNAGVGRSKPSGFGRSTVRVSSSTGRVTGTRAGRSGSFGRIGGGSSG